MRSLPSSPTSSPTTLPHASFTLAFYRGHATFSCVAILIGEVLILQAWAKTCLRVTFLVIFPSKVDPLLSPNSFFFFSYTPHPVRLIPPFSSTFKTYLESSPFFPFPSLPPWPSHYRLWPRWLQYPLAICFPAFVPYTHTLCSSLIDLLINSSDASCPSLITCLASAWNVGHLDR